MERKEVLAIAGVVVGVAGVVAVGFLLKKFLANKSVSDFEETLVEKIVKSSPLGRAKKKRKSKKRSKLVVAKLDNARKLLSAMKKGKSYTQVMLQDISHVPYRSVRRYTDVLVEQGKLVATGYGKGKRYSKA